METNTEHNGLIIESADAYHAKASEYMSSHQLIDYIKCPLLFRKKQLGMIEPRDSATYAFGRAAHTMILEGEEAFTESYTVSDGPINEKTGNPYGAQTKAYAEWLSEQDKPIISSSDYDKILMMRAGVMAHEKAKGLLSFGVAERVVRTEYCDTPCQIRADWLYRQKTIVDLKTCDDLDRFEYAIKTYSYARQLAFYRNVYAKFMDVDREIVPVYIIAVEKKEPYRCGVWLMGESALHVATDEIENALANLKYSKQTNNWPTGYESVRVYEDNWKAKQKEQDNVINGSDH